MPTARTIAYISGHAGLLWNQHVHKKAELEGLTIDNQHIAEETIKLYDCFTATSGKAGATGTAMSQEDLGTTNVLSGKVRLQMTVPAAETVKLGQEDCKGIEFLGKVSVIASVETSDCVVIAQYHLK